MNFPVYCINLASATDRWKNMKDRCQQNGLPVQRWEADTPATMLSDAPYADYLTDQQRACASSHVRLWRHFMNHHTDNAVMILEDDALFLSGWRVALEQFFNSSSTEWDAIFLNVSECIEPIYRWTVIRDQCLTAAYILSRSGAQYLLDSCRDGYYASDFMTQNLQARGRSYSYFPWLVIQDGTPSTIQEDNSADIRKIVRILSHYGMSMDDYRKKNSR